MEKEEFAAACFRAIREGETPRGVSDVWQGKKLRGILRHSEILQSATLPEMVTASGASTGIRVKPEGKSIRGWRMEGGEVGEEADKGRRAFICGAEQQEQYINSE